MRVRVPVRGKNRFFLWRAVRLVTAALFFLSGAGGTARADGLNGYMELTLSRTDATAEDSSGEKTETDSERFLQRYSLSLDRRIYPNLTLYTAGLFERNATTTETDGTETDTTVRRIRPVVELRLRTPLYIAEGSYNRNEEKTEVSGASPRTDIRESYFSNLQWKPDGFPHLKFQYFRNHTYDRDRMVRDTTEDQFQLTSEYRPVDSLLLWYQGTLREEENLLEDISVQETMHSGRVNYSDSWREGLITVYSDYKVDRRETETEAGGGVEVTLPVFAIEGLSAIDDTPEEGALNPNPALIDGNLTAGTGINLGLPPPGGDIRPRNAGLRFDDGTKVNTLYVWVDRELPPEVAGVFSWQMYSSDDNRDWVPVGTAAPAAFDTLQNRFEVRFPDLTKRYVKVVVDPLTPTDPRAAEFPAILVTELRAAVRTPAAEAVGTRVLTVHRYNLDIRTRLLKSPILYYEFSYLVTKPDPGTSTWTLSNGLNASHRLTPKLSVAARASREDGRQSGVDREAYIYSASLTAVPLDTLRHTLVFSALDETVGEESQETYSLFLQNNAQLYQGVDMTLGGGVSQQSRDTGEDTFTTSLNGLLSLVPNRKMTVNLYYNDRTTERSGGGIVGEETEYTRSGEVNVTLTPVRTIYLFGSWGVVKRSEEETRRTQRYSATFSPFPGGTLQVNFFYSDEFDSQSNRRSTIVSQSLRWNITRRAYLDLTHSDISDDSDVSKTDSETYNGTFRVSF